MRFIIGTKVKIKNGVVNKESKNVIDYSGKLGKVIRIEVEESYEHSIAVLFENFITLPNGEIIQTDYFSENELEYISGSNLN